MESLPGIAVSAAGQPVDEQPQAAVVPAVEPERDPRQLHAIRIIPFLRRRRARPDGVAGDEIGEVLVERFQGSVEWLVQGSVNRIVLCAVEAPQTAGTVGKHRTID
jgi:hypothetical protein